MNTDEREDLHGPTASATRSEPPTWEVGVLTEGGREALIRHEGQIYRLRITANRKLILTK